MKIAGIQTGIVALPNDEPLAGFSENPNAKNPIVTLRIRTDDGVPRGWDAGPIQTARQT